MTDELFDYDEEDQPLEKRRSRCRECQWLNYDFLSGEYERDLPPFCGLHGRTRVDPNGWQMNFNHHGGCGFHCKYKQLTLFDLF